MEKTISLILTICTLLIMINISPLNTRASELINHRNGIINAVINNESKWSSIRGNKVESFFMDLDFDGKNEYVVVIYGQGIMITTRVFSYDDNGFSEATDNNTMSTINATSFEYYFHQTENKYLIVGTKSSKNGSMSITTNNYQFLYDNGINVLKYSGVNVSNQNYSYYKFVKDEAKSITKSEYDTLNAQKLKHCANANVQYKPINYSNWKVMSKEEKTEALEKSYDGFSYKHFRSLEIGKDTNNFPNDYSDTYMIHNPTIKNALIENTKGEWEVIYKVVEGMYNEYHGICRGICDSMCMAKDNRLNLDYISGNNDAQNYWELGSYIDNQIFRDLLCYYQLNSWTKNGQSSVSITNNTFTKLRNKLFPDKNKSEFLKILVDEAKYAQAVGKPFLFAFLYKGETGHVVTVVGYYYNEDTQEHELTIYDVNCFSDTENLNDIPYLTMTIKNDYSDFSFKDENHNYFGGKNLGSNWEWMAIYNVNHIYHETKIIKGDEAVSSNSNDKVNILVKNDKKFRMENNNGKFLAFDGNEFSGDIAVYNCNFIGEDINDSYWKFTIDPSSSFTFTDMDPDFEVIGETTTCGFSAKANGANTINAVNDTLTFVGDNYKFSGAFETDNNYLFVETEGNAKGTTVLKKDSNQTIMITPQNPIENTVIKSYSIDSLQTKQAGEISDVSEINIETGSVTPKHLIGDVNNDNNITIDDATTIQRHLAEMITLSNELIVLADANRDGKVDINDASHLQRYLAEFDVKL